MGEIIHVGPQFPAWFWHGEAAPWLSGDDHLKTMLDRRQFGSVLYISYVGTCPWDLSLLQAPFLISHISFGTIFYPHLRDDLIEDLLATLVEAEIPFIMSAVPPSANLSQLEDLVERSQGLGIIAQNAPQISILQHPAVGFVLVSVVFWDRFGRLMIVLRATAVLPRCSKPYLPRNPS